MVHCTIVMGSEIIHLCCVLLFVLDYSSREPYDGRGLLQSGQQLMSHIVYISVCLSYNVSSYEIL